MVRRKKTTRLVDVSNLAGVSMATVSRVLNSRGRVAPEIQERVRAAAKKLGMGLGKRSRQNLIAFLLGNRPRLHPFHSRVLSAAESYAGRKGYGMLFLSFDYPANVPAKDLKCPRILEYNDIVDGFIIAGMNSENLLEWLSHTGLPFSVLGNNVLTPWDADIRDVVWFDDIDGSYQATRHLLSLGHQHIWYVGNLSVPWYARRHRGYAKAMSEAGFRSHEISVELADDREVGFVAAKSLHERGEPVTAIFAGGDPTAIGVYEALSQCQVRVPEDISVAAFDDLHAHDLDPPLTSVKVFMEEIGKHLVDMVLKRLEQPDLQPQRVVVPTRLILRRSCQSARPSERAIKTEVLQPPAR